MGECGEVDDINNLIAQCSSSELEAILHTLDSEGGIEGASVAKQAIEAPKAEAPAAPTSAPEVVTEVTEPPAAVEPESAPAAAEAPATIEATADTDATIDPASLEPESVKEVVGAVIRKSLQEGIEIQEKLMAQYGTSPVTEPTEVVTLADEPEASSSSALNVSTDAREEVSPDSPVPTVQDAGRIAPPPSPVMGSRECRSEGRGAGSALPPAQQAPAPAEVEEVKEPEAPKAVEQAIEAVSATPVVNPVTESPTLETLLQLMKDQHQSVVAQVQWVASMSMPSTEYLTGVLNQKDADIAGLQAKLDHLRAEVQAKDDRIETQCVELNECVQSCRHWLVDLEFHKQKLDESMQLSRALEDANKNLEVELEATAQQVKHASLDVEHGGGFSRTPIVTPRMINIGWGGGYNAMSTGYGGIPMQGSIPWVFRKNR